MAIENKFLEYGLSKDAYVAFDALTLKDFIVENLNDSGQFTDQIYEGSNMSAVIDIVAYSYHVLMFYLNTAASESTFDQATIYENMNKIVKFIGYKPTGKQTSLVAINATATDALAPGSWTIKRNSFFMLDGIQYTALEDYVFDKTLTGEEVISALSNSMVLYQGTNVEYPTYIAEGEPFEILPIVDTNIVDNSDDRFIADNTISVYVKELLDSKYYIYTEVDNLYLHNGAERVYEKRLNELGNFEIKFGNGSFGKTLELGDEVAIYYIKSDNEKGIISPNTINGNKLFNYNTQRFTTIFKDVFTLFDETNFIDSTNNSGIVFNNPLNSSIVTMEESVDDIRATAPKLVASQLRLVSDVDYEKFLIKNVPGILRSVKVLSNKSYINEYLQYFYDICVDPYKHNRVLINQVNFADACDFNNINIFCVPTFKQPLDGTYPEFLSSAFKNLVVDLTAEKKIISAEVVPRDPIYMANSIGFTNADPTVDTVNESSLVIVRENSNKINKNTLKVRVEDEIKKFFDPGVNELGQYVNITELTSSILGIEGVKSVKTVNNKLNISYDGVSLLSWNPLYPESDINIITQSILLPSFKFPYLYNPVSMSALITVVDE